MPKWLQIVLAFVIIIVVSVGLIAALIRSIEQEKQASSEFRRNSATDQQSKRVPDGKSEVGHGDGPISAFLPITPAPLDQQPVVAPDFGARDPDTLLTRSGYPIVVMSLEVLACSTPWLAKEAGDAWRQNERRWLDSLRNCVLLPAGTQAEWVKFMVPPDASAVRLALRDGSRLTLYIPGSTTTGVVDRFRYRLLSQAREAAQRAKPDNSGR